MTKTITTINGTDYKTSWDGSIQITRDFFITQSKARKWRGTQINAGWNVFHNDRDIPESQHGDDIEAAAESAIKAQAAHDERKARRAASQEATAKRDAEKVELKRIEAERGPLATPRQVDYIMSMIRRYAHEEGGFYNGPTTIEGVRRLTKAQASIYITSLTGNY